MGTRRPNAIALQRPTLLLVLAFSLLLASCGGGVGAASGAQAQRTQGLSIGPSSLPDAVAGNAYSASLSATGNSGSVTWSITSGSLPSGLSLDSSTGLISGTPTTVTVPGSASFTVQATDATGAKLSEPLSIRVAAVLAITTTSLPAQNVGVAYNQTVKVTGGIAPYALSISAGTLPPGLTFNTSTGAITGTPTTAGVFGFTVRAADSANPKQVTTQALTIIINGGPLTITTTAFATGIVGAAYGQAAQATGGTPAYKWALTSGALPAGLALNASTGTITGTPTGPAGTSAFTLQVSDSSAPTQKASANLSITITDPLTITAASLGGGAKGVSYTATLTASGGTTPYTWSVIQGALPGGLTLNASTGTISGTPTTTGTFNFKVQVVDSSNPKQTATGVFSIAIGALLSVATTSLPDGVIGAAYSTTAVASGGLAPYTWSTTVGSLPAGLTLNTTTGAITGTPTGPAGTSSFTLQVTDSSAPTQTATANLSITVHTALQITTTSLLNGIRGTAYSQTLAAAGGAPSYTWSITAGALPSGLTLNASTGAITGTPNVSGTSNFTVKATDSSSPAQTATANLSIAIHDALSITTTSLPGGVATSAYTATLTAIGGAAPFTWSVSVGSLPAGLSLNASTGAITGTPTATGTTNFTIQVADSSNPQQSTTKALSITVTSGLSITTTSFANGVVGVSYSQTAAASGGTSPFTWSISAGALPAGLTLAASTGVISGKPTAAGTSNFTLKVTDASSATATAALSIKVSSALSITTVSLANGAVGAGYSQTLAAAGGLTPYTWGLASGALPGGLTLAATTGVISGTPTASGTFGFTVKVTDNGSPAQTATKALSIKVQPQLTITTSALISGTVSIAYNASIAASGGVTPYTFSISSGALPAGLTLNSSTGVISGTPTTAGTFGFTAKVTDSGPPVQAATKALSIVVNPSGATPAGILYVAGNATGSIYSWNNADTVSGSASPNRTISPSVTDKLDLLSPFGLFVDAGSNQLYVVNNSVFLTGMEMFTSASTLTGSSTAPSRTLSGPFDASIRMAFVDTTRDVLYVTDGASVFSWANASTVNGTPAPTHTLTAGSTGLQFSFGVFVDTGNNVLYVSDIGNKSVRIWNNASTVGGGTSPSRVILGANTQLTTPFDVLVDTTRNVLYVANGNSILVWNNASTVSGNVAPNRVISGANTLLTQTCQMTLDTARDTLYVGTGGNSSNQVVVFANASTLSGNATPTRVLTTPSNAACGVTLDTTRN